MYITYIFVNGKSIRIYQLWWMFYIIIVYYLHRVDPSSVLAKVLRYDISVSKFELQL